MMHAVLCKGYGTPDVLEVAQVPDTQLGPDKSAVLIRVHCTSVNSADVRIRRADPFAVRFFFGLSRPRQPILGAIFSGTVIATGSSVKRFRIDDRVFGSTGLSFGANAEFLRLTEQSVMTTMLPEMSFEQAAAIPFGGFTAAHFLLKANLQPGQRVLIIGASGAVGTAALQLAKYSGAHVTAVCSGRNEEFVKKLGADETIDYKVRNSFGELSSYDIVIDTIGKVSANAAVRLVKKQGVLILAAGGIAQLLSGNFICFLKGIRCLSGMSGETIESLELFKKIFATGRHPPIENVFPLNEIRRAHMHVDTGRKRGNVIVTMAR